MERNDELWQNYLKYRAESSRNLLAGWTFGFVAGPAVCDPSTMKMLGMMAVSTATGVFDFPAMINGTPPFQNGAPVPQNNLTMSLWNMALQSRNNNPQ